MSKKKKVRVAFKKNRQKRTRANDLTRVYRQGNPTEAANAERVRAKGELSRHRTIIAEVPDTSAATPREENPSASQLAINLDACVPGRVIRIHGLVSIVEAEDGRSVTCHLRRLLKTLAIGSRNIVAVGDRVWFRPGGAGGEACLIEKVEARRGMICRGYRRHQHVLVSNVDQLLIVSSLSEPGLKLPLIDRYLISSEVGDVRAVIVLNKADLVDLAEYQWVIGLYTQLGYETILTSALSGLGIEQLRALLAEGTTAVTGQSGVGKSSLLNAIQPGLNLRVSEISDWTFKGKHTTATAELIRMEAGGCVIDTPGLRQFELWGVKSANVDGYFVEFRPYIPLCKFPDCSHTHENDCAVKDAVHWGQIHFGRYESYLKLFFQQPIGVE